MNSFIVPTASGVPIAVALNFDARDEPDVESDETGGLMKIMIFLEFVESSVRDAMLPPGKGELNNTGTFWKFELKYK